MKKYKTSEVAAITGMHPNTVRYYEEWGLISRPERQANGYRVFTELHIQQIKLAQIAFQIEILQSGLRKKVVEVVKCAANCDFDKAIEMTAEYRKQLQMEALHAKEAIKIVRDILDENVNIKEKYMKRKEVSECLNLTMDTLRNWEMNGLLSIKRKANGYRVYTAEDISRLKIIRTLRCANYSLEAILRMLNQLDKDDSVSIETTLDTPTQDAEITSVCDRLVTSLQKAEENADKMTAMLQIMKKSPI